MGAAGFQLDAQVGVRPEALQHPIVRHGRPAGHANRHPQPVAAMAPDGLIDGAAAGHDADAGGHILARHGARLELPAQGGLRLRRARHHQQAARVLVEAMDQSRARQRRRARDPGPSKAFCRVWRGLPAPGCTTSPGGLVDRPARPHPRGPAAVRWPPARLGVGRPHPASSAPGRGTPPPPGRAACRRCRPTCTAPASIQPLIRVRECCGSRRANALSSRWPANSGGIVRSITWNSAVIGHSKLAAGHRVYCRAFQNPRHCKESLVRLRDLVRPSRVLLLALGVVMLAAGCRSHRADDAKSGPEVIYARAQKAMKSSSYGEAIKQLEALQSRFPIQRTRPPIAARFDLRLLQVAQIDPAIDAADTFIRENPTNPRVDYAYYMKGLVYFERQSNWLERKFNVDLSQRPPVNATQVLRCLPAADREIPAQRVCRPIRAAAHGLPAQPPGRFRIARRPVLHAPRRLRRRPQSRQVLRREL